MGLDWGRRSTWWGVLAVLLVLGGTWIVWSRIPAAAGSADDGAAVLPRQGYRAPDWTLETMDGDTITLSALQGQAVVINFWATWCPPCRAEMPAIEAVYAAYRDQGLQVLAVNMQEGADDVAAFVAEQDLHFPVLLDAGGQVARSYRVTSIPTTFFIDRSGVIREVIAGGPLSEAVIESHVRALLEGGQD